MHLDFSEIKKLLSYGVNTSKHREVIVLSGEHKWQQDSLREILSLHEKDTLWLAKENVLSEVPFVEIKKASSWLGKEKQIVVFDANDEFEVDSFAAITGIVLGGGLFFLLLPLKEKWDSIYHTYFGQRFIESIKQNTSLTVIHQCDKKVKLLSSKPEINIATKSCSPYLTKDQQTSVEVIEKEVISKNNTPIVLISDRGRGKSAALGIAAAKLLDKGIKNIIVTAPRLTATDIIFKHISMLLPNAKLSKGRVTFNKSSIQFYPPDKLIQENIDADLLLIDEAAAIPVPMLRQFLDKFKQCVFATTVHGYEGTGRGFTLRFFKHLDKNQPRWIKRYMKTPVRWAGNDPLENWMFDLLCLNAEMFKVESPNEINFEEIEYSVISKEQLFKNASLLNEVFSLLVLAHYKTRPKDLMKLLDDEDLSVYSALYHGHVIAVSLVVREGNFPLSLSSSVYRGERRPNGHLLAQALTYHCGIESAATLDYARIMRIAVHPVLQNNRIGTALVKYIIQHEKNKGRDAIGTSFGINQELLNFWNKINFSVSRIGFSKEQTSGEHAAIMLLPFTEKAQIVNGVVCSKFTEQLPYWLSDVLSELPMNITNTFTLPENSSMEISESDKKDIQSFKLYSRNYELCISALNKLVKIKQNEINANSFPLQFKQIFDEKLIKKNNWKEIAKVMKLNGQNEARKLFHQAVLSLSV